MTSFKSNVVLCLVFWISIPSYVQCLAQVVAVEETFRGNGEFETVGGALVGMDSPGWSFSGSGQLTPEGYHFSDRGTAGIDSPNVHRFGREIISRGSYIQKLEVSDLNLSGVTALSSPTAGASVSMSTRQFRDEGVTFVILALSDSSELLSPEEYHLGVSFARVPGRIERGDTAIVPRGSDVSLTIEFNEASQQMILTYDADTTTADVDWTSTYAYNVPTFDSQGMSLFAGQNSEGETDGFFGHWSIRPFSDTLGDFSGNALLDVADIDLLVAAITSGNPDAAFDLTDDGIVNADDVASWVHDIRKTYFGDANLDGEFNSRDFVTVFEAAEYEDAIDANSTWGTGDWNGDGDFTTADFVFAFQDGGYERGPRVAGAAVPEPSSAGLLMIPPLVAMQKRRRLATSL